MTGPYTAPARIFSHRRILELTPQEYLAAVRLLAEAAQRRHGPVSAVIGIANGGLPPAQALGQLLEVPVYRIDARHNPTDAPYTQATGHVIHNTRRLTSALAGRRLAGRILLVDDICGTGATFYTLRPAVHRYLAPGATVHTVALCRNIGGILDPDLWLWTVDDWVRFPWEPAPPTGGQVENLIVTGSVQPQ
ncbi:MAG: phosphoribosyltransferase [Pseudonocardiaceae bacterium]